MAVSAGLIPALEATRETGVRICMDNFGMGQSLYALLARVALDIVRVDVPSLAVRDDIEGARQVLTAIVQSTSAFDVVTIAGGVSNAEMLETAEAAGVALVAVGGYGRGELHPCSDIDVMILLPKSGVTGGHDGIERFLAFLWDIGLEVGHSVRTIDDCQRESAADVSVATTLIEARLLSGPDNLFQAMRRALGQDNVWNPRQFFEAKVAEQTDATSTRMTQQFAASEARVAAYKAQQTFMENQIKMWTRSE